MIRPFCKSLITNIKHLSVLSIIKLGFVLLVLFVNKQSHAQFVHPGGMNTKADLDFIKAKINANEEPWKSAYQDFLTSKAGSYQGITPKAYSSLQYVHHPRASVNCGSYNDPNEGCNDIVYDGMAAYSLALRFYITEDQAYATKAREIMDDWSDAYEQNTESNSRLIVSWATPWYVNAGEILRYTSGSGWTTSNTNKLNSMLNKWKDYIFWEGKPSNNWMMSSVEARLALAVFQNDQSAFDNAVEKWKQRVKTYIFQSSDGSQPIPPAGETQSWTNSLWHDRNNRTGTAYVDGLCMETCRDISHTKLGVNSLANGAEIAWSQGIDLFDVEKERFKDFLELHSPWMMGANPPNNICDGYLDIVSEEAFEILYNHLHDRLNINLPQTKTMLLRNRPNDANRWVTKWETLCYADRPFGINNQAPTVIFDTPLNGFVIEEGYESLYTKVSPTDDNGVANVKLYIDDNFIRQETNPDYEWGHASNDPNTLTELLNLSVGDHVLKAIVEDDQGLLGESEITITITEKGVNYISPIHDAYLQGTTRFNDADLKVEAGNRVTYLMFDMSSLPSGQVVDAQLEITVDGDPGNGTIRVFEGNSNVWTEDNLSTGNAPGKASELNFKNTSYTSGTTYSYPLPNSSISDGSFSLIMEMDAGGNDVWFASKENTNEAAPRLKVKVNEAPEDCHGDVNGTASIDQCGICAGGNTGVIPDETCRDCNNQINGEASIDECGICSGGETGFVANASCSDCIGVPNGSASIDDCGICSGGTTGFVVDECLICSAVIASTDDGNVAENVLDDDLNTRWSANGSGNYIEFCMGDTLTLDQVSISFFKGDERQTTFDIDYSVDGINYQNLSSGEVSGGLSNALEDFDFFPTDIWKLKITCFGNTQNGWNSLNEVKWRTASVLGSSSKMNSTHLYVYPNPGSDRVVFSDSKSREWTLTNVQGEVLDQGESKTISLSQLARGMYFVATEGDVLQLVKE